MEIQKEILGKVSVTVDDEYWDSRKVYDKLVIVERAGTGTTYISRKPVPAGTSISNRKYWIKFSKWSDIPYEITQEFGDSEELAISQKTFTEKVNAIQEQINALLPGTYGITISCTPSVIYEGNDTTVTIVAKTVDNKNANYIAIEVNGTEIAYMQNTNELTTTITVNNATNVKASAKQNSFVFEESCDIITTNPYYVGSGSEYTDIITEEYKQDKKVSPAGTYDVNVENNTDYIFFVIPSTMTINAAYSSGFEFPLDTPYDVQIEDINYKVYRSSNTYDQGSVTIIIS